MMDPAYQRVLIVAADPTLRFVLEEILRFYRYEVTTESSEERVAATVGRYHFDALVLVRLLPEQTNSHRIPVEPHDEQKMGLEWIPV